MKKVTITALVGDDTNQNEFKNWLKSCPFSFEGGQTITWENVPAPEAANEGANAPADAPAKAVGE
jgi:hypothetical protein